MPETNNPCFCSSALGRAHIHSTCACSESFIQLLDSIGPARCYLCSLEDGGNLDHLRDRLQYVGDLLYEKYMGRNVPSQEAQEFSWAQSALDGCREARSIISRNGFESALVSEYYHLASDLRL